MSSPRLVCVACQTREVSIYDIVCPDCRPQLVAAGVIAPQPDNRIQIGPTDI